MELYVKLTMNMAIKLREHSGELTEAMVRRYLTKTVEPKDKPMNIISQGRIRMRLKILWKKRWRHGLR